MMPSNNKKSENQGVYASIEELLQLRYACKDLTLESKKRSVAILDGDAKTHFRGRGIDFAEVRPYQPGDDIRNIDWRVTARTQKPYTKLFQEERERPVFILVDQRSPMFFGSQNQFKSVLAAKIAASIGWIALSNNDRIGALVFSDTEQSDSRARRGKHTLLSFMHLLHSFNAQLNTPVESGNTISLDTMLMDLRRVARPGSSLFIISDFHDFSPTCQEPLALLSRHTDVTIFNISDPLEKSLPIGRNLLVSNGQTKTSLAQASNKFLNEYSKSYDTLNQLLQISCNQLGIRLGHLSTEKNAEDYVRDIFHSRNKRKSPIKAGGHK